MFLSIGWILSYSSFYFAVFFPNSRKRFSIKVKQKIQEASLGLSILDNGIAVWYTLGNTGEFLDDSRFQLCDGNGS